MGDKDWISDDHTHPAHERSENSGLTILSVDDEMTSLLKELAECKESRRVMEETSGALEKETKVLLEKRAALQAHQQATDLAVDKAVTALQISFLDDYFELTPV